jgi:hypothetical protein
MATLPVIVTNLMHGADADDQNAALFGTFRNPDAARDILNRSLAYVQSGDAIADRTLFLRVVTIDQDLGDLTASAAQKAGWTIDIDVLASRAQANSDPPPE